MIIIVLSQLFLAGCDGRGAAPMNEWLRWWLIWQWSKFLYGVELRQRRKRGQLLLVLGGPQR